MYNKEMMTVDQFEKMCDEFDVANPTFDYLKATENLRWLVWPNSSNYTIWLVEKNPNYGKKNIVGAVDTRAYIRGAARFVHFETRREFDRVKYAIEDLYKRLENGRELQEPEVQHMSSVVDDIKNPSGQIHVAEPDEITTRAGDSIESHGQTITNGQDFKS